MKSGRSASGTLVGTTAPADCEVQNLSIPTAGSRSDRGYENGTSGLVVTLGLPARATNYSRAAHIADITGGQEG
jgi:hypothetical protein